MLKIIRSSLIVLLLICFASSIYAEETVFGPLDITVKKNKAKQIKKFNAEEGQTGTLTVTNGVDGTKSTNVKILYLLKLT